MDIVVGPADDERSRGVYGITVAADLVGTTAANLRSYERAGLLEPSRTDGGTRLYSLDDIGRLRRITELLASKVNLAGIAMILPLQDHNAQLEDHARKRDQGEQ